MRSKSATPSRRSAIGCKEAKGALNAMRNCRWDESHLKGLADAIAACDEPVLPSRDGEETDTAGPAGPA